MPFRRWGASSAEQSSLLACLPLPAGPDADGDQPMADQVAQALAEERAAGALQVPLLLVPLCVCVCMRGPGTRLPIHLQTSLAWPDPR